MSETSDLAPRDTRTRGKISFGEGPVIPLFLIGAGMYLAWFGVHYWRSDVKWPTDPVKAVLQGRPLPSHAGTPTEDEAAIQKAAVAQLAGQQGVTPSTGQAQPNAVGQAVASGAAPNQNIGKLLAASYGWSTGQQWDDLVKLWDQESGWNNEAENPSSHAYGIPQALPWTKMPQPAWPPRAGGKADPHAQIAWGLAYIKGRYGSPSAAWAHEQANNWY